MTVRCDDPVVALVKRPTPEFEHDLGRDAGQARDRSFGAEDLAEGGNDAAVTRLRDARQRAR